MLTSLATQNWEDAVSGSRLTSVREISGPGPKILDLALVKNWAQTRTKQTVCPRKVRLPSRNSFGKGGRGISVTSEKKPAKVPEAVRCLRVFDHCLGLFVHEL